MNDNNDEINSNLTWRGPCEQNCESVTIKASDLAFSPLVATTVPNAASSITATQIYADKSNRISFSDDAADSIAEALYDKVAEKVDKESLKMKQLKEDLNDALDVKIKMLPIISTGLYSVEFKSETGLLNVQRRKELLEEIKRKIDEKFNINGLILVGVNNIEPIDEESIDKKIKELEELKKCMKDNRLE